MLFSILNISKVTRGYTGKDIGSKSYQPDNIPKVGGSELAELYDTNVISKIGELPQEEAIYHERPKNGEEIGELYIPKLKANLPIYEGTSDEELEIGVGHYTDSVLPGEKDNTVLSGHRDTVFRNLGKVGKGDALIVRTGAGEFEYRVNKVRIVDKNDRTVIVPKPRATLTVSTCYPFTYTGSAPKRYILVAYLVSSKQN